MRTGSRRILVLTLLLAASACGPSVAERLAATRVVFETEGARAALPELMALAEEPPEDEARAIELSWLLLRAGKARSAVAVLEPRRPKLGPDGLDMLSEAMIAAGRAGDASEIVNGMVARGKDTAKTRRLKGMLLLAGNRARPAVRELEDSLRRDDTDPLTWAWLGIAHIRADDPERAEALLRQALGRFPDSPEVRVRLAAVIQMVRPDTEKTWLEVVDLLTPAVKKAPHERHPRHNLAIALRRLGRLQKAEAALRALTEDWPGDATYWSDLGVVLIDREKLRDAVKVLERARDIDAMRVDILLNLGNAYLEVIQVEFKREPSALKAQAVFKAARTLAPKNPEPLVGLARATLKADPASDPKANEAMRLYREALKLDPDHFAANFNLALLYYELWMPNPEFRGEGRRKALHHFQKAAKIQAEETWDRPAREAYESVK